MVATLEAGSYTEFMQLPLDEFLEVRKAVIKISEARKKAMKNG